MAKFSQFYNDILLDCPILKIFGKISIPSYLFLKLGFIPCKTKQPLRCMKLQKKKHKKKRAYSQKVPVISRLKDF